MIDLHINSKAKATLLTAKLQDAGNYGRIIRNSSNTITAIREAKDCTAEELKINEFNSGIYCFETNILKTIVNQLTTNNAQNEYYLTVQLNSCQNQMKLSGLCG